MSSTFSPILRIELIGTGDQSSTWGSTTNVNLGTLIEQAIAGTATVDVSIGNVTLTNFNGTTDQARCAALRVIGTPGTSRNIIAPAASKLYVIANGSDAAVVIKTSVSTGYTVTSGTVVLVYYDTTSTDFRLVGQTGVSTNTANTLVLRDGSGNFAAGTITAVGFSGPLTGNVTGNVTGNAGTVTNGVYTIGDQTIAGVKTFSSSPIVPTPTTNTQAANKLYVDSAATPSFPSGTRIAFQQTAAPTGWTKDTTAAINDSILRLVTGSVTTGGATGFSTFNGQTAVGATTLSTAQIPSHTHTYRAISGFGGSFSGAQNSSPLNGFQDYTTGAQGGGGSHDHSITTNIKYYDFIIASKN